VKTLVVASTAYAAEAPVTLEEWRGSSGNYYFSMRLHRVAQEHRQVVEVVQE